MLKLNNQEQQRYEQIDLPFYKSEIAPVLPERILDFHTHVWTREVWNSAPCQQNTPGAKYMVTTQDYSLEDLLRDGQRMFPDRGYEAVCFGQPTPAADVGKTNDYIVQATNQAGLYPLMVTGKNSCGPAKLKEEILQKGFFGYKVYLNWLGDDYGNIAVADMIGPAEMELANASKLVVLLHVPGGDRLASPVVQNDVERLSREYPNANIVLAHCGRCYLPDEAKRAMGAISRLENVYLDTAMVMDPTALEIVLDNIASKRLLFATDLPIARMRGRRVYVMDHWADLVLEGYDASAYRVGSNNMRATYMVYEIILAIRRAAERIGLSEPELRGIFYRNGKSVLEKVVPRQKQ
jgi:predicted TIM-barrel fold metal-dependent hydrolase